MLAVTENLAFTKYAQDLRDVWQGRVLAHTRKMPIGIVVLSVLAHSYDDAMPVLLRVVFPGFTSIQAPFLSTAGRIAKTGHIVADVVQKDGRISKNVPLFRDTAELQHRFRKLADEMKLSDADRTQLFAAVQRWVVADMRLDPNFDPKDPDAKRLH